MAGEFRSTCKTCSGSGSTELDTPVTVLTVHEVSRPQQLCRSCDGTGASIGVKATIEDYLNYFDEPCTIADEIFSLAQQIQKSQGPLEQREVIELHRFTNRRWIPQNPGTYFENSIYVPVLLPDGNFAIQHYRKAEFENPELQVWGVVEEDTGWYSLRLQSLSDLLILFDFNASLYSSANVELSFETVPPGRNEADFWKNQPWKVVRYYEKGFGLLKRLRKIHQDIQQGKNPLKFARPDTEAPAPAKSSEIASPTRGKTSENGPSKGKEDIPFEPVSLEDVIDFSYTVVVAVIAGLLTVLIFVCAYYASHFFTHMWAVPWGSAEAVQFAFSSAEIFEYSLGTAVLWGIISAVFLRVPWITLLAAIHGVQSGIAWPMVFLIPPLLPAPGWVSAVLEAVTVGVHEWLFFTSLFVVILCPFIIIYTEIFREDI